LSSDSTAIESFSSEEVELQRALEEIGNMDPKPRRHGMETPKYCLDPLLYLSSIHPS
jgi:hypothetical protein